MGSFSYIGVGSVYAGPYSGGKLRKVGNCSALEISVAEEVKELKDYANPGGGTADSVRRVEKVDVSMTLHELSPENMALAVYGENSQVVSGSVTDEQHAAYQGGLVRLDHVNPTSVVVSSKDGDDASAWQASTTYNSGDYVIPSSANQHYYKCTTAGDSDVSEPTWPTDGSTVTDGTAVWTDMGTITRGGAGVDYEVKGAGLFFPDTSGIEDGRPINVDYSHAAEDTIQALLNSGQELTMVFDGVNEAQDDRSRVVDLYRVRFGPTGNLPFIGDDFAGLALEGTLLKDSSKSGTGISQYFKETLGS